MWELTLKTGLSDDGQTYVGQTGATGSVSVSWTGNDDEETGIESGNENHAGSYASQKPHAHDLVSSSSFVGRHSNQKRREHAVFSSSAGLSMVETGETDALQTGAPV